MGVAYTFARQGPVSKGIHRVSWGMHATIAKLFLSQGKCSWYLHGSIRCLQPVPHGHHEGRSPGVACLTGALDERCLARHLAQSLAPVSRLTQGTSIQTPDPVTSPPLSYDLVRNLPRRLRSCVASPPIPSLKNEHFQLGVLGDGDPVDVVEIGSAKLASGWVICTVPLRCFCFCGPLFFFGPKVVFCTCPIHSCRGLCVSDQEIALRMCVGCQTFGDSIRET